MFTLSSIFAQQARVVTPAVDTFQGQFVSEANSPNKQLTLWYRRPAKDWNEALPVGNGRLGAMIFGGIEGERLQLNEDTLWAGSPYDPSNPEALQALPEVRRLIFEGKLAEAEKIINERMMAKPFKQMPYQTVGDLRLSFPKTQAVSEYRRELDIDSAVAKVSYKIGDVVFTREIFSSSIDNVIVIRLTASKRGQISFDSALQTPQKATVSVEGGNTLVMNGKNGSARGIEGKLKFQTRVKILTNGGAITTNCGKSDSLFQPYSIANESADSKGVLLNTVTVSNSCLSVKNADSATILISAATSYKNYQDISGDEITKAKNPIEKASKKSFEVLKNSHTADYQKYFRRLSIKLGNPSNLPTDKRIKNFSTSQDTDLAALYFQFGRYLLISSSRPGSQPSTLQGIWNDSMSPPWDSKYTININTEMNYWLAEPTNLSEMVEPLVKMVEEISQTGAKTAQTNYGARGWVTHHNTDLWRATAPIDSAFYGMWQTGGAWLTMHLWEHYEYTNDKAFLARIYPILKGSSQFFLDFLIEDPKIKYLVTSPAMSPENRHPLGTSITAGTTMDSQIIRDLLTNTIHAAEILDQDKDFQTQLKKTRDRLPPNKVGKGGQLQEWLEDWDLEAKDPRHRHVSHLYGAFPSWQINVHDTPQLAEAVKKTLDMRGDKTTGWAIAWRLNLWSRLRDGERAYKILELLIHPERTYPNMFDAHPPFQIDGNFGGTSGMTEMLMQNRIKNGKVEIELLPALPQAFANGEVAGLKARNNILVNLKWQNGKLIKVELKSLQKTPVKLHFNKKIQNIKLLPNKVWNWKIN